MLLVLSVPSINDKYYRKYFEEMIDFYIKYALEIKCRDSVVVLADKDTMSHLTSHLPADILLQVDQHLDPWIRDTSPVFPNKNVQFMYYGGLKNRDAKYLQKQFNKLMNKYGIKYEMSEYVNDGGNFIDNGSDCIAVSDKFCKLNHIGKKKAVEILQKEFNVEYVAIIPSDDEKLGHIDGQCSFLNERIVLVRTYPDDKKFEDCVIESLEASLPVDMNIVKINVSESLKEAPGGFTSSYGIYVNCVPTEKYIYVPVFGDQVLDNVAKDLFEKYAQGKECVFVDAVKVCDLGGSLRCLSWQVTGENAEKLITAAKCNAPLH